MIEVHVIQCCIVSILWSLSRKETTVLLVTYNASKVLGAPKVSIDFCVYNLQRQEL